MCSHRKCGTEGSCSSDTLNVNESLSHLRASGGSLVPDTLMELRDMALLKKCLNDGGTSLPFLQKIKEQNKCLTDILLEIHFLSFFNSATTQGSIM